MVGGRMCRPIWTPERSHSKTKIAPTINHSIVPRLIGPINLYVEASRKLMRSLTPTGPLSHTQIGRFIVRRLLPFLLGCLIPVVQVLTIQAIAEPVPVTADDIRPSPVSQPKPTETPKLEIPEDPFIPVRTKAEKAEDAARMANLIEGDRLFQAGKPAEAAVFYKQAKTVFTQAQPALPVPEAIVDPEKLSPAAQVYWREASEGFAKNMESRSIVAIDLLSKESPNFLPGQTLRAKILDRSGQPEDALKQLEALALQYPNNADLQKTRITQLAKVEKYLDASIAARQFSLLKANAAEAPEFTQLADDNLDQYRKTLRRKINNAVIGNVITGAIGTVLTGGLLGPLTAAQSAISLLQGESGVGRSVANQIKKQLPISKDEALNTYVNEIGMKLSKIAGRKDFDYEFTVILDETINAFALPGGKVFVNAGAIAKTDSEAELAGLLGHEISHAALTHGFQLMAQGNFIASILGYIPYAGGLATDIVAFNYSREMERQADDFGTRILVGGGYAADGLRSLMLKLEQEELKRQKSRPPEWLSTHPGSEERVKNIETLIRQQGFDRYTYEGADRHAPLKQKAIALLKAEKKRLKEKKKEAA